MRRSLCLVFTLVFGLATHTATAQSDGAAATSKSELVQPANVTHIPTFNFPDPFAQSSTLRAPANSQVEPKADVLARLELQKKVLQQAGRPCYTMRTYNYTADAVAPEPTNSTTCLVARSDSARYIVTSSAKR